MTTVRFTDAKEFIEELERDRGMIERGIVRLTNHYMPSSLSPNIWHLSVIASCKVGQDLVRFQRYCGDAWGKNSEDQNRPTRDKADEVQKEIEKACQELGLEVRPGIYEEG